MADAATKRFPWKLQTDAKLQGMHEMGREENKERLIVVEYGCLQHHSYDSIHVSHTRKPNSQRPWVVTACGYLEYVFRLASNVVYIELYILYIESNIINLESLFLFAYRSYSL